ncbi:hypothetical protein RUND412_001072 [Rhizina undulata]
MPDSATFPEEPELAAGVTGHPFTMVWPCLSHFVHTFRITKARPPGSIVVPRKTGQHKRTPLTLVNDVDDIPSPPLTFEFIDELRLGENILDC